jgi:uncharacterized oligopeptide transporter (OPT) family protein
VEKDFQKNEHMALPTGSFEGTPEEIDRQWFEQVYRGRGDVQRQLTWRAVLMGSVLGGVLSLTNIYITLKAGWGFGVAITACILSYAIWTGAYRLGIVRTPMSILENNCMQSTASAAGYSTGGTLGSAFAAYLILSGHPLPLPLTLAWVFFLAVLGVTMAIPMKRQMIDVEQLPFPSGIAAAETLRALHAKGTQGLRAARALGISCLLAALDKFWSEGVPVLGTRWAAFSSSELIVRVEKALFGSAYAALKDRTLLFSWDAIFVAAGAIMGLRVCVTLFVSGTLCWAVYVPVLQRFGWVPLGGFRELLPYTLWGGTACMVTGGLLAVLLQWRSAVRAFRSLGGLFARAKGEPSERERIETPLSWFFAGQLVSLIALGWLAHVSFAMPYWQSGLAVAMSFALALVACRITGETDTTPIGALGKVTQLTFGALNPGNVYVNLMGANITSAAAVSSADLLTDLKSGYLLGANPRKQFLAQFAGIFVGTVATTLAFSVLVPNAAALGTEQFPAPAAQTWAAVAQALSHGLSALAPVKVWSIAIGGGLGIVFALLPLALPRWQAYLPSASAFGLAWVFDWHYGLLFLLGALIASGVRRRAPKVAEAYTFPVASGVIAGGSLMGVALVFWQNGGDLLVRIFGR